MVREASAEDASEIDFEERRRVRSSAMFLVVNSPEQRLDS